MERIPQIDVADWALLDVHDDVASLQALDEYYPIPVRFDARHRSDYIDVNVIDPQSWLAEMGPATLRVDGSRFGLRQSSRSLPIAAAGKYTVMTAEPTTEMVLEVDGVALDVIEAGYLGVSHQAPPVTGGHSQTCLIWLLSGMHGVREVVLEVTSSSTHAMAGAIGGHSAGIR